MFFKLFSSQYRENQQNCFYPKEIIVTDKSSLEDAVKNDYVCAKYEGNRRGNVNFIESNCVCMDCDNDHSDNKEDWVNPLDVEEIFPNVCFFVHYSRNHMRGKDEKSARPRFHILFNTATITDVEEYTNIKKRVADIFGYFDRNALDAGRFFYGTESPQVECHFGTLTLTDFLNSIPPVTNEKTLIVPASGGIIPQGQRNNQMYLTACKLFKRFGVGEEARKLFFEKAQRCEPPLDKLELDNILNSALNFYNEFVRDDPNYVSPEIYDQLQGHSDLKLMPSDLTDVGQADILAREYSDRLRYWPSANNYIVYNGSYWTESSTNAHRLAQELTDRQLEEVTGLLEFYNQNVFWCSNATANRATMIPPSLGGLGANYKKIDEYHSFVLKSRQSLKIKACLKEAEPKLLLDEEKLDANEFLLNTPRETYDLMTGSVKPHSSSDFITNQTKFDPSDAGKEMWDNMLNTVFCCDRELIDYVQEVFGLAAIGKVYEESIIIALGEGRNGKSTFLNAIASVLGTYSGYISSEILTKAGTKGNPKNEMANLRGKRLVIANELNDDVKLDTAMLKKLCSTDKIMAERKYKDPAAFTPTHTLILCTNYLPEVRSLDEGTWRRISVIPFNAKIEGTSDVKNYASKLVEESGEAILSWIIKGAGRVIENKYSLTPPRAVQVAIRDYREDSDWLSKFLDEYCLIGSSYKTRSSDLYLRYQDFCVKNGERALSHTAFGRILGKKFDKVKGKFWEYLGISLKC